MGSCYVHYKHPDMEHRYQVVGHAIPEATEEVAVLYKALYMPNDIVFARALRIWQEAAA
jgi:hypothetical protein